MCEFVEDGRSAVEYGCTHVLVLRSYPDGKLLPKSLLGLFERLVAPKCLDPFPEVRGFLKFWYSQFFLD
jgi:hypothetical protein